MRKSLQPARIANHPAQDDVLIAWRAAGAQDDDLLRSLFAQSRPELELLPEPVRDQLVRLQFDAQRDQYRRNAPDAVDRIIEVEQDGRPEPVGRCYLWSGPREHRLLDLAIRPQWRRRGIGGAVLGQLCAEAARTGVPLTLSVWAANQDAQRLYRRLGFVQEPGAANGYLAMRWSAEDVLEGSR